MMTDSTDKDRKSMFNDAVRNLECCAELVIKQLIDEERHTQLEELKSVMLEYCDLDNNWKHEKQILSKIEKGRREDSNVNKVDELYANLKKNEIDADPHKHEWYLNLERKIKQWITEEEPPENASEEDKENYEVPNMEEIVPKESVTRLNLLDDRDNLESMPLHVRLNVYVGTRNGDIVYIRKDKAMLWDIQSHSV